MEKNPMAKNGKLGGKAKGEKYKEMLKSVIERLQSLDK